VDQLSRNTDSRVYITFARYQGTKRSGAVGSNWLPRLNIGD